MLSFATGYCVIEIALHFSTDTYFVQQVALIAIMLSPVLGFVLLRRSSVVSDDAFGGSKTAWTYILSCTSASLGVNVIVSLIIGLTGLQISPIEVYLFYAAIAVAEECTFRFLIVGIVTWILEKLGVMNIHARAIPASISSAMTFMIAHWNVYGSNPLQLAVTGVCGFIYAYFYAYTKNPLVSLVPHVLNNLIAASFVFTISSIISLVM